MFFTHLSGDFMYIYDGNATNQDHLMNVETGIILPSDVKSSSTDMIIIFTSDFNLAKKGFMIEISYFKTGLIKHLPILVLNIFSSIETSQKITVVMSYHSNDQRWSIGDRFRIGEFPCANSAWIPLSKMCDGIDDCGDDSDESTVCSGMIIRITWF